jgi:phosphomannomutase
MTGKVVVAFSVSDKVKKMCVKYGLPVEVTKIGFKYISEKMVTEDVLVGGEESGGIAVKGHIPERDAIQLRIDRNKIDNARLVHVDVTQVAVGFPADHIGQS